MVKVIKKSGKLQKFMPAKITKSIIKAGAPLGLAKDITAQIKNRLKGKVSTKRIGTLVVDTLNNKAKQIAKAAKAFKAKHQKKWRK